jgi:nucleoside-diphosphate-sugar epimerase
MVYNKKVLITGATGFIGANLTRTFLEKGADVSILTREKSNKWRIEDILCNLSEYCVDLTDRQELEKAISHIHPEIILHTAVYGGFPFQKDFKKTFETNLIATINLLETCEKTGFELFINTGSSSEYGIKKEPIKESDILRPLTHYGISKALATLFCRMQSKPGLPVVTLRLFSPYGYYEEPTRLIPSVILSCLKGESPRVSSPNPVRDFIFVEDVVDAYLKVVENKDRVGDELFNIGYGVQYSVEEVVNKIIFLTGNRVKPEWGSVSNARVEPQIWQADISKAKDFLKWVPEYSLDKGLDKTIKWFGENKLYYEK